MKELLAALAAFGQNPEKIGDQIFTLFSTISKMEWDDLLAAGAAIKALQDEAHRAAMARDKDTSLQDPTYRRLKSCLDPVVQRAITLIAKAPAAERKLLLEAIRGRSGFLDLSAIQRIEELIK